MPAAADDLFRRGFAVRTAILLVMGSCATAARMRALILVSFVLHCGPPSPNEFHPPAMADGVFPFPLRVLRLGEKPPLYFAAVKNFWSSPRRKLAGRIPGERESLAKLAAKRAVRKLLVMNIDVVVARTLHDVAEQRLIRARAAFP